MRETIQSVYDEYIRGYLPKKWIVTGDIAIRTGRLLDISNTTDTKKPIRKAIRETVKRGDTVVVIGGGHGTTTVEASRMAGWEGSVITYEPVSKYVAQIYDTVEHNYTAAEIEIRHQSVGEVSDHSENQYGGCDGGYTHPSDLPKADVYVLDCEGTESEIMPYIQSDRVVLELHKWSNMGIFDLKEWHISIVPNDKMKTQIFKLRR